MPKAKLTIPNARFFSNEHLVEGGEMGQGLFEWQTDWLEAFDNGLARFSILEIHRRARKSSTALNLAIRECARFPRERFTIICPSFAEAKRIYWNDPRMLIDALPDKSIMPHKRNKQDLTVTFGNGSLIQWLGGDDPDHIRGIDAMGQIFDEWSLCKEECWTEVLQPILRQNPKRWVAFLYTTKGPNHAAKMMDRACCLGDGGRLPSAGKAEKMRPGWYAARLTADVSGIIIPSELAAAKEDTPETYFNQEYLCARIMDEDRVLISSAMLDTLNRAIEYPRITKRIISCDPAMGGDECSMAANHNTHVLEHKEIRTRTTSEILGELIMLGTLHKIPHFIVDNIGVGKGVYDGLCEMKDDEANESVREVIGFCSSETIKDSMRANLRAEMWWHVMKEVRASNVEYPADDETRRQIPYASRYKVNSRGQIQMQEKDIIKKDLGCSPDRAERWAMGIWGLSQLTEDSLDIREFDSYGKIDRGQALDGFSTGQSMRTSKREVNVF